MAPNKVKGVNLALTEWQERELKELTDNYGEGKALIGQIMSTHKGYYLKVILLDADTVKEIQKITGCEGHGVKKGQGVYVTTG